MVYLQEMQQETTEIRRRKINVQGEEREATGVLSTMGAGGDYKTIWNRDRPDEVESARRTFDELRGKGYLGFRVSEGGDKGEQITEFDPRAEALIMVPPLQGG